MNDGSITQWFGGLREGDERAVAVICERYFDRLVAYARNKMQSVPRKSADEEDVALSALHCFAEKVANGNYSDLKDRTELWRLLLTITAHKASDERKRQTARKRGGGDVRGESVFQNVDGDHEVGLGAFAASEPTPDSIVALNEQIEGLLAALPDESLRKVASLRLQGHSVEEIAAELPSTKRTVIRKLNRIREKWSLLLNDSSE